MKRQTKVLIIGAGLAGIAAAIYIKRYNIPFVIASKDIGGQMATAGIVENYPAISSTTGMSLTSNMLEHMHSLGTVCEMLSILTLEQKGNVFLARFNSMFGDINITPDAIIICTGRRHKMLPIEGINEWYGKGISVCATCDAPLYKGKNVAVIGGGNSALDAALILSSVAGKVYIINKNSSFKGEFALMEQVKRRNNVTIVYNKLTTNICGVDSLTGLSFSDGSSIEVEGAFVAIGNTPNTDFINSNISCILNGYGEIVTKSDCSTAVQGLFAAGDVTSSFMPQIIIASGSGAQAAMSVRSWLHL